MSGTTSNIVFIPQRSLALLVASAREMQDAAHAARVAQDAAALARSRVTAVEAALREALQVPEGSTLDLDRACFVAPPDSPAGVTS